MERPPTKMLGGFNACQLPDAKSLRAGLKIYLIGVSTGPLAENVFVKEIKSGALNGKQSELNYTAVTDFTGRTRWVYQELRDRKVALFIDKPAEGV